MLRAFAPFDIPEVSELLSDDEVDIYSIGTEKTAFFMITSDNTSTYDFLGAMIFSLMFTKMFEQAYKDHGGRLPIHVRFILDEFANMGVIPDADKKLSVMRSRNMSASIVLQSISQLEKNYKDTKETLIDNCDSLLFLGSKSNKTNKEIAEQIGKATVHNTAVTESKGSSLLLGSRPDHRPLPHRPRRNRPPRARRVPRAHHRPAAIPLQEVRRYGP